MTANFAQIIEGPGDRYSVVKYGSDGAGETLTQKRDKASARDWCRTHGWTVVDRAPEMLAEGEGDLSPFQRKVVNRSAAANTLRRRGLIP